MPKTLNKNNPFESWNIVSGPKLIIAGPCSAESEDQLLGTARELVRCGNIDVLRAGI